MTEGRGVMGPIEDTVGEAKVPCRDCQGEMTPIQVLVELDRSTTVVLDRQLCRPDLGSTQETVLSPAAARRAHPAEPACRRVRTQGRRPALRPGWPR
jgi:hypothetical protein